ncbi:EsaB/YukD family protein [Streptomyces cylindrosporus]|uniref:EsaB/YukD family protein n=1 Tax=Streptomyces cylindrosporus TaxID=2927583 RepID=A0ABS9YHD4_9ACTN|nr:EsaB/YukD family protein [Streptomyces cylindrosporus]MCI3276634.1 EsaB/YukD family protein [Streptomyces cylindrosporus]
MSAGALSRTAASGSAVVLSRVTLVGERRRIELVLPAREPVGALLPEILRVLDDGTGGRPGTRRRLVTADGSELGQDSSLESAGVPDGAVLRLLRDGDGPYPPVEVAEGPGGWASWWGPGPMRVTAGVLAVGWAGAAGLFASSAYAAGVVAGSLFPLAVVAGLAGVLVARGPWRGGLGATLLCVAGVLALLGGSALAGALGWPAPALVAVWAAVGVVTLLLLGLFTRLGRGGLVGAAAVGLVAVGWEAVVALESGAGTEVRQARVGAVLAVASVVALGVLPRLALRASGLAGLDDRRAGGVSVSRYRVSSALAAAHRGLVLATVVVAGSGAVAAVWALRVPTVWTVLLAVVAAVVMVLRARAFPLVAEVVVLLAGGALVGVRLLGVWAERVGAGGAVAVLVVLAVLPLAAQVVRPTEQLRVRLRRAGDLVESAGVVALLPLLIGVFGVYGRLLDTLA